MLRTRRLILRDFEADDWPSVQEYSGDPEAVRFRPFGPCSEEETRRHVLELAQQSLTVPRTLYDLAIVLVAENRVIGGCDIGLTADDATEASMGYGLARRFWGQGYMTEAAAALVKFGFEELNVDRVSADAEPENVASVRVLEKVGMRRIGQGEQWMKGAMRSVVQFVITRDEWIEACGLEPTGHSIVARTPSG
jgi:RimJ/RimL family protein N-acetyltransferase